MLLPEPNFWGVIHYGDGSYENRYNRVFRWLLDPNENHGAGSTFLNALLQAIPTVSALAPETSTDRVRVQAEYPVAEWRQHFAQTAELRRGAPRIDVLVDAPDHRLVVAIESKMGSVQSAGQLDGYRSFITKTERFADRDAVLLFLTEREESAGPDWHRMSYTDFAALLADKVATVSEHTARMVREFIRDIERRSDSELHERTRELFFMDDARHITQLKHLTAAHLRFAGIITQLAADRDTTRRHDKLSRRLAKLGASPQHEVVSGHLAERLGLEPWQSVQLVETLWTHRPDLLAADMSRVNNSTWIWGGDDGSSSGPLTKRQALQRIGHRFLEDSRSGPRPIATAAEFSDRFVAEVLRAVPDQGWRRRRAGSKAYSALMNPMDFGYSATDIGHGYEDRDLASLTEYAETSSRIHLEDADWLLSWELGLTGGEGGPGLLQYAVIRYFADPEGHAYPLTEVTQKTSQR